MNDDVENIFDRKSMYVLLQFLLQACELHFLDPIRFG